MRIDYVIPCSVISHWNLQFLISSLAHAVDFQDIAEGLLRSITNHLEVGKLFLQLSGVAFHTSWLPSKGSIKLLGLAAWFASWPGPAFYLRQ